MRLVFAFAVGLLLSYSSYQWITDSDRRDRRVEQEAVVYAARTYLEQYVSTDSLELSDPLDRVREAGKVYLYPIDGGWELSGHYRRAGERRWHAFLMRLDDALALLDLSLEDDDPVLREMAASDPKFSVSPP